MKEKNKFELKLTIDQKGLIKLDWFGELTHVDRAFIICQLETAKQIFLADYIKHSEFEREN